MPCYRPLPGFRSKIINPKTGKRPIVFSPRDADNAFEHINIPCGQCIHCRLERSRQWAVRCLHEAQLHENNCFITLTYDDEHLPKNGCLDLDAPVLFMKKLRKKYGNNIRSYGCAEYGEKSSRPHFHLLLFNHDFHDKKLWKEQGENSLYVSDSLKALWGNGFTTVGNLTFESAAYTARYVTKKISGREAQKHYERTNESTGEVYDLPPERSVCVSRRPGIGKAWFERFGKFVKDHDYVIIRGKKCKPAKYYDRLFDFEDPQHFKCIKEARALAGEVAKKKIDEEEKAAYDQYKEIHGEHSFSTHRYRVRVMEDHHEARAKQLKRNYENGD